MNIQFAEDVREGLSSEPKYLLSKYFYDKRGDELIQKIMGLDEYYLTNSEYEIFDQHKERIRLLFSEDNRTIDLIEFGAGDGYKTKVLLRYFLDEKVDFKYIPIDISSNILKDLVADLNQNFTSLKIQPICDDYFHALEELNKVDANKKIILFLGSNIGNFKGDNAIPFLKHLGADMTSQDRLLIGFDLKKDPEVIMDAYSDSKGITSEFNYNLLKRINNELEANFNIENFSHFPTYDPVTGEMKSYLISRIKQTVNILKLNQTFNFEAWEPIFMEISQKYSMKDIEHLALHSGFKVSENFFDTKNYFVNSLWHLR